MVRTEVIPFREFVRGEWKPKTAAEIVVEHVSRHKIIYRAAGITLTLLLVGDVVHAHAAGMDGIDAKAEKMYEKLARIGKWVIIGKGAFDAIGSTVQGDFIAARKSALGYLMVYLIVLGLPWAFGQIEDLFQEG